MNAWTAWVGWLRGGGGRVGPARGGSNLTTQFIHYLEWGRLGEIYHPTSPPPPSHYKFASKDMLQNYFLIRTYENVNKEEE